MFDYQLIESLRVGELALPEYLAQAESWFLKREPSVLAFIPEENRFERLHKQAEALLSRFPDPENRPPLFGMLVGVKDNFHVEGFITRAGSQLPWTELQGKEAESITRLKNAGALILGKTFTTEFAYFSPGPTRNPYNHQHTPGGSSSGSAASVGAGLCPLALGTQTIGSVIRPAAYCGIVAFKPTYDRISRSGIIPLSPSLDHVGVFASDVESAFNAARVLCKDWEQPTQPLKKPRLGIPDGPLMQSGSEEILTHFEGVCMLLENAGYELEHIQVMPDMAEIHARHHLILSAEAAQVHQDWFRKYEGLYAPKTAELIRRGQSISPEKLQKALTARDDFQADIRRTILDHNIDVWISPSSVSPAPKGLDNTGDPIMNLPWTQAGLPAINLPAGKNRDGLTLGLQVVSNWYKDESLLFWSKDLEKALSSL